MLRTLLVGLNKKGNLVAYDWEVGKVFRKSEQQAQSGMLFFIRFLDCISLSSGFILPHR